VWQAPETGLPQNGCFYPPTLVTGVAPASTLAQEEIFGPVLVTMSFRALDVAPRLACGVVWVNATNLFDAAAGFGGYRESGYGREGGREGLYEYLQPRAWLHLAERPARAAAPGSFE